MTRAYRSGMRIGYWYTSSLNRLVTVLKLKTSRERPRESCESAVPGEPQRAASGQQLPSWQSGVPRAAMTAALPSRSSRELG